MSPRFEPAIGRYLHLDLLGRPHRLYVEEAGQGIPLLCLHTAGSDGRQYRGLLNDARITKNYRVIVFDMPWHGKSSPPVGWENEEYKLTSRDYVRMILEVSAALELDKPVVMGCSIGGRIVLHLAHEHPEKFRAIVGLESSPKVDPVLRHELAASPRRARRRGLRRHRVGTGRADRARRRPLGNAVALHAERPRRVQGRPLFLHDRRRHLRQARPHRRAPLPALSAHRRIRLFLHHRGHARSRAPHRRAGDHHEGPRPFPDERESRRSSSAICCRCWKRSEPARRRTPHEQSEAHTLHPAAGATATIVNFANGLRYADLDDEVRYYARRHLLDTVGVMIAGAPGDVATNAETMLASVRGGGNDSGAGPRQTPRPARCGIPRRHRGARHRAGRRLSRRLGALRLHGRAGRAQRRLRARRKRRADHRGGRRRLRSRDLPRARLRARPAPARLPSDQRGRPVRRGGRGRQAARSLRHSRSPTRSASRRARPPACSPSSTAAPTSSACTRATPRAKASRPHCWPSLA